MTLDFGSRRPVVFYAKILEASIRILAEQKNFQLVPRLVVETLGSDSSALGITDVNHCLVYLTKDQSRGAIRTLEIPFDYLWCARQPGSHFHDDAPCHLNACPARQAISQNIQQTGERATCFPLANQRGFVMTWAKDQPPDFPPAGEVLKLLARAIDGALEDGQSGGKSSMVVVPPGDVAQIWSEMLAGLSHDLRTPLSCVKGYATTLLREDVAWDPESRKEFLSIIVEETDHIEKLIHRLLDSSTLSRKGEIELQKELVMLPQIIGKVIKDPSYQNKHHVFIVRFPENFPQVEADPVRIEQVIRNLVENAIKFSREGTLITFEGEVDPGEIVVSVSDQGIGISDEHLNMLFEMFFRVLNSGKEQQKGMGLGLPLARQLITCHGGRIWAKSKLNQGTTFYFTLPLLSRK